MNEPAEPPIAEIRLAVADDAAAIAAIYAPAVTDSAISFEATPPAADEVRARIAATLSFTPWLVCSFGSHVVGYAYASKHRDRVAYQWSVEVSAYVSPHHRGRGIATALYTSLFALLRLQGFRNAYAGITLPNQASVALHAGFGFTRIGIFDRIGFKAGAWHDVLWLHREVAPRVGTPEPPVPLPALTDHPRYRAALAEGISLLEGRS